MNLNINQTESKSVGCVVYQNRGESVYMIIYDTRTGDVRLLDLETGNLDSERYGSMDEVFQERKLFVVESASLSVIKY